MPRHGWLCTRGRVRVCSAGYSEAIQTFSTNRNPAKLAGDKNQRCTALINFVCHAARATGPADRTAWRKGHKSSPLLLPCLCFASSSGGPAARGCEGLHRAKKVPPAHARLGPPTSPTLLVRGCCTLASCRSWCRRPAFSSAKPRDAPRHRTPPAGPRRTPGGRVQPAGGGRGSCSLRSPWPPPTPQQRSVWRRCACTPAPTARPARPRPTPRRRQPWTISRCTAARAPLRRAAGRAAGGTPSLSPPTAAAEAAEPSLRQRPRQAAPAQPRGLRRPTRPRASSAGARQRRRRAPSRCTACSPARTRQQPPATASPRGWRRCGKRRPRRHTQPCRRLCANQTRHVVRPTSIQPCGWLRTAARPPQPAHAAAAAASRRARPAGSHPATAAARGAAAAAAAARMGLGMRWC